MNQLEQVSSNIREHEAMLAMRPDMDSDRRGLQRLQLIQSIYVSIASYKVYKVDGFYDIPMYFLDTDLADYMTEVEFDVEIKFTVEVVEMRGVDLGQLEVIEW